MMIIFDDHIGSSYTIIIYDDQAIWRIVGSACVVLGPPAAILRARGCYLGAAVGPWGRNCGDLACTNGTSETMEICMFAWENKQTPPEGCAGV